MPSRTAVTAREAYGQKKSRMPRVNTAAATARVIRLVPRAASGPGSGLGRARASEEVNAASLPRSPRIARLSQLSAGLSPPGAGETRTAPAAAPLGLLTPRQRRGLPG